MNGICQNCHQAEGSPYQIYYGNVTSENDREALYLPRDKETAYKIMGKFDVFMCKNCIHKYSKTNGTRISIISSLSLAFGIIFLVILRINDVSTENFVYFFPSISGCLGIIGLLLGVFFIKSLESDTMVVSLAKKIKKEELRKIGAKVVFSQKDYDSLRSNLSQNVPTGLSSHSPVYRTPEFSPGASAQASDVNNRASQIATLPKPQPVASTIVCPRCGYKNPSSAITCDECMFLLEGIKSPAQSEPPPIAPQHREPQTITSLDDSINAAANLATINAVLTLVVAILQFIAGGEAMIAGVINAGAAIYYFIISTSIRKRDLGALEAGKTAAKWGFLWVAGMLALYVNTAGGIDCIGAFIFGGWLITDGLLYLILNNIKSSLNV